MSNETITIILSRASGVSGMVVPNLCVEARVSCDEEPPTNSTERDNALFFESQARRLVAAMMRTLPGALIDAIMAELMTRRACQLRVPLLTIQEEMNHG